MTTLLSVLSPVSKVNVTPEQHVEAVKGWMHSCLRVKYVKSGLPKSKQASGKAREAVASAAGGADEDSFSVSKRLFKSRGDDAHPLIANVNEWARMVDKWRNTFTFSMAADDTVDAGVLKKAKGERLIRAEDVEAFEDGLVKLEVEGVQLSKQLYEKYDEIMAMEKARFKNEFKKDDYPEKDGIYQVVENEDTGASEELCVLRVGKRHYSEVTASVKLPKVVMERMTVQAAELMNQSLEVAVSDVSKIMVETFSTLAEQLVDRVQVKPRFGTPVYKTVGAMAEVLKLARHDDDPNVPEGKVLVTLSYKADKPLEDGEDDKTTKRKRMTVKEEFGPITEKEYQELRPEPMDSTKKLTKSVVERFGEYLETFSNLKAKLGAYGEHMDEALDALREIHHKALTGTKKKDGAEAVIESVKYSSKLRNELKEGLESVCGTLADVAEEVKVVRRKIHYNIAAQVAKPKKGSSS